MWLPGSLHSSFHTSSLSHADCSCHILSAAAETTPSSSCFPSPTFPPPTAALFCAIISTAWLTGLLCFLLPSSHSPLAKLIDLPLCRPKVKRNLIRRGRSSSGNSCTGCEMKMRSGEGKPDNAFVQYSSVFLGRNRFVLCPIPLDNKDTAILEKVSNQTSD